MGKQLRSGHQFQTETVLSIQELVDSTEEITKSDDYDIILPWLGTGLLIS